MRRLPLSAAGAILSITASTSARTTVDLVVPAMRPRGSSPTPSSTTFAAIVGASAVEVAGIMSVAAIRSKSALHHPLNSKNGIHLSFNDRSRQCLQLLSGRLKNWEFIWILKNYYR